jgi:hypothetical protein
MAELDDTLAQHCMEAIQTAARELEVEPLALAKRLHQGEIARLAILLNAARQHVTHPGLRHRIEDLLSAVTDGRLPMFGSPETELDWALKALRRRRKEREGRDPLEEELEP